VELLNNHISRCLTTKKAPFNRGLIYAYCKNLITPQENIMAEKIKNIIGDIINKYRIVERMIDNTIKARNINENSELTSSLLSFDKVKIVNVPAVIHKRTQKEKTKTS
jgi:hypothetical protein